MEKLRFKTGMTINKSGHIKNKVSKMKKSDLVNLICEVCDSMEKSGVTALDKINTIQVALFVNIPGFAGNTPHKEPKLSEDQKLMKALVAHHQFKEKL